jgi:hypothetical protein
MPISPVAKRSKPPSLFDASPTRRRPPPGDSVVSLHEAAQSGTQLRAVGHRRVRSPDVRDGLKPVQLRILYTMGSRT